jgi:hypothetical protein
MSEEKVLFEMRITEDERGRRIEITESPGWKAYYASRPTPGSLTWISRRALFKERPRRVHRPGAQELRHALDSLQGIYDDLYGHPAEAES